MPPKRRSAPLPAPSAGFADQLRQVITSRRLTAYSVARAAGVAPSVVSRFLSRERGLTLETFDQVAGALGLRLVEGGRGKGRPARGPGALLGFTETGPIPDAEPEPVGVAEDAPDPGIPAERATDATPEMDTPPDLAAPSVHPGPEIDQNRARDCPIPEAALMSDGMVDGAPAPGIPAENSAYSTLETGTPPAVAALDDVQPAEAEDHHDVIGHMVMDDDGAPPACLAGALHPEPEQPPVEGETPEAEAARILDLVAGWPPEWRQEHENVANFLTWEGYSWEYAQAEAFRRLAEQVAARVEN